MESNKDLNHFAKDTFRLLIFCLVALCLHGCLELIRRPAENAPVSYGPATASVDTNRTQPPTSTTLDEQSTPVPPPIAVIHRPHRSREQWRSIEQINEYAMWCIENSMWNEAQSHMERALAQDSLSASLHNNLGIVYERLGMVDKAADFYSRAQALNPPKKAYAANLSYLQKRRQAVTDSTGEFNIFKLENDLERGSRRPGELPPYRGE